MKLKSQLFVGTVLAVSMGTLCVAAFDYEPAAGKATEAERDAPVSSARVEMPLADVLASQGNAALRQIRAESTRLPAPSLDQVAVADDAPAVAVAAR